VRISSRRIYFVPPSQTYEAPTGYVLEVVEVDCEEEDCYDEYEYAEKRLS